VQPGPAHAQPAVPADLVVWAGEVDVSQLSNRTFQDAEAYLKGYRHMNLDLSQQMGWRLIAAIQTQVTPSPPADAQPVDVLATVVAQRRKQLGIDWSSPSALAWQEMPLQRGDHVATAMLTTVRFEQGHEESW
jgi:hypothetical protein